MMVQNNQVQVHQVVRGQVMIVLVEVVDKAEAVEEKEVVGEVEVEEDLAVLVDLIFQAVIILMEAVMTIAILRILEVRLVEAMGVVVEEVEMGVQMVLAGQAVVTEVMEDAISEVLTIAPSMETLQLIWTRKTTKNF